MIARAMHDVITSPPPGIQNVTEWSKNSYCWEKAREAPVELLAEFAGELCESDELLAEARAAKALQKLDTGISAQATVVELGRPYWTEVWKWSMAHHLVGADEDRLLRLASGMLQGLPTDWQSKKLLQLKARLEIEGLAPPAAIAGVE